MEQITAKEAFANFKPENCVMVISVDNNGKPSGMTAAWNMKISHQPPLIAVCLSKKGYTHELIQQSKEFVVAVPNKDLEETLLYFGTNSGRDVDKFAETKVETTEAKHIKPPLITNATLNFECKVWKEVKAGDHIIFIGEILAVYENKDKKVLLSMRKIDDQRTFEEI